MDNQKFDYLFKIVLRGDSNVGKTNILSRLIKDTIPASSKPTFGDEIGTKTFTFDGIVAKAQIWDTAGQERYHAITAAYYRGSNGAVVVYDITKKKQPRKCVECMAKKSAIFSRSKCSGNAFGEQNRPREEKGCFNR